MEMLYKLLIQDSGLCTELFLSDDMLEQLVVMSEENAPQGFRNQVLKFSCSLISSASPRFLINNSIHKPLRLLMNQCISSGRYEEDLVNLEYEIVLKINEMQELLPIFFNSDVNKFPIFDHLLKYCHSDGRIGDYCRTACCLLLNTSDSEFERFLQDMKFADVLISTLCGLLSLLPETLPESSRDWSRISFHRDFNAFRGYYRFIQQILEYCPLQSIKSALVADMVSRFYNHSLVTMISNGSDFDGTCSASLFYLSEIVDNTANKTLAFQLAHTLLYEDVGHESDLSLTPRDILLSKLNSLSEDVVLRIIPLFGSLIEMCDESIYLLFSKLSKTSRTSLLAPGDFNMEKSLIEIKRYFTFQGGLEESDPSFQRYIHDAFIGLQRNSDIQAHHGGSHVDPESRIAQVKKLCTDQTLYKIMSMCSVFFGHSMRINIALTGLLNKLACHGNPILFTCLFSADQYTNETDMCVPSFYSLFEKLQMAIAVQKPLISQYDEAYRRTKHELLGKSQTILEWVDSFISDEPTLNVDNEFLNNVVVLEEFVKEILAILITKNTGSLI